MKSVELLHANKATRVSIAVCCPTRYPAQ
uniref:Uncharacterized protein n=1 Tax=Arundo donax TaxID=35708 RepID=A0A0A9ETR1_ARUDO